MKYSRPAIFALVMLLYLWYPYTMIRGQEKILEQGTAYRFKVRPVDPVDAFRGRYIILGYDNFFIDSPTSPPSYEYGQEVYAMLAKDAAGYAYFSALEAAVPESGDYIATTILSLHDGKARFKVPENMNKYFLNENIAPEAERIYNQLNRRRSDSDSVFVYVDTKIHNGNVLLEKVYFKDQTVEDYIRTQLQQ